jgi:hypothetical protein
MGRKPKEFKKPEDLFASMAKFLVPENILKDFEITDLVELKENWLIDLVEKVDRIPSELNTIDGVVLDGFCNPLEMLSHSFSMKPVRLKVFRRRWKRQGENIHFSNEYDLTLKGVRLVPELGFFLKAED